MKKLRVGVIYGGRSSEHEVSLASAASVIANFDRQRYEPVPIRIDRVGRWSIPDKPPTTIVAAEVINKARQESGRAPRPSREAFLVPHPGEETLITIQRTAGETPGRENAYLAGLGLDVIFPVLHGTFGEDGTLVGGLTAVVAFVGMFSIPGSGCAGAGACLVRTAAFCVARLSGRRHLPSSFCGHTTLGRTSETSLITRRREKSERKRTRRRNVLA